MAVPERTADGLFPSPESSTDNITDWCLVQFQARYGSHITKDDIWEYLYGVMHAPDWRERYRHDLQRNLPRVPLAADFEAFRSAGRELMDLHVGYEDCHEMPLECLVDGEPSGGDHENDAYRIHGGMRWGSRGEHVQPSAHRRRHGGPTHAHAGNTYLPNASPASTEAYPRSRGEHPRTRCSLGTEGGLPPLTRGNTGEHRLSWEPSEAYPRSRGKHW